MSWQSRADRITHDSPVYVWQQIADDLRAEIESGELQTGARLPSGPELGELYGVARLTAVKAVNHLRDSGLVTVVSGKGTFVTSGRSSTAAPAPHRIVTSATYRLTPTRSGTPEPAW